MSVARVDRRLWQRMAGGAVAALCQVLVWAQPAQPIDSAVDARGWLVRLQEAAGNHNYRGTLVFSAGGNVSSSRVAHYREGGQRYERTDALDGQPRTTLRYNDRVQTLWPSAHVAVTELREAAINFPALPTGGGQVAEFYELRSLGLDRIAGHDAQVLMFKPRDALRFAQRLWAERNSGLLLRADVLGTRGEVLESSAFSDVSIGGKAQPEVVLEAMKQLDGYRVVHAVVGRIQLEAEGWALAHPVAGFSLVSSLKRPLDAASADATKSMPMIQAIFSDGLTHVSVFVESYDAQRHKPMRTSSGATHTLMMRSDDWWITVVGDVPMATVQQFATALERRR